MPGKVKVRIFAGRNLPVMDKSSDTSDAYVEIKLGNTTFKTDVCRKSLNPTWNTDWFKFEVDDQELQDEPLQIRIMDYDTYSANDSIGKVYIDLGPLLLPQNAGSSMAGWIPIFDTMHGIRGEVNVAVKVDLFSDFNRFRQSSCGVQFFCSPGVPFGYRAITFHGFVEELVVNDDPEYQWIDKIRTPRASNEARQTLFSKLSGEVQRKIGLKAVELGGNAVIGYQLRFDLEGESGIVVRGIGTAVTLSRHLQELYRRSPSPTKDGSRELCTRETIFASIPIPMTRISSSSHSHYPRISPLAISPTVKTNVSEGRNRFICTSRLTPATVPRTRLAHFSASTLRHLNRLRSRSQSIGSEDVVTLQRQLSEPYTKCLTSSSQECSGPTSPSIPCRSLNREFLESLPITIPCSSPSGRSSSSGSAAHSSAPTSPTDLFASGLPSVTGSRSSLRDLPTEPNSVLSKFPLCCRSLIPEDALLNVGSPNTLTPNKLSQSFAKSSVPCVCRRSSDSELNVTAKGTSGIDSSSNRCQPRQSLQNENIEVLEYPFFSMSQFPIGFIFHLGGVVSSNSVKLLGRINNPDEPEARDSWWMEIRMEIRSHARALGCNVVLGYSESTSICEDICILSASGTAAVVCLYQPDGQGQVLLDKRDYEWNIQGRRKQTSDHDDDSCNMCHIPYSEASIPFPITLSRCSICRKGKVPDVLFATIAPPAGLAITGKGCLIQARVSRTKRDNKGEANAKEISDSLPFLQYELHRQLLNKLKVKGMNSLFCLDVQVVIGAKTMIAIASATATYLTALPPSQVPRITWGKMSDNESRFEDLQRQITDLTIKNREIYNLGSLTEDVDQSSTKDEEEDLNDELPELDLSSGNKDTCVLEMDDSEDMDIVSLLNEPSIVQGFEFVNTEIVPGTDNLIRNLQMFHRVWRSKLPGGTLTNRDLSQCLDNIIQSLSFKLRKMIPCAICSLRFMVDLPDDDELQVTASGIAIGLGDPTTTGGKGDRSISGSTSPSNPESDLIFMMEDEPQTQHSSNRLLPKLLPRTKLNTKKFKYHAMSKDRIGIDITPLSYVPGASIDRYIGNLNCFFIRESTSVRESGGFAGFVQSFIAEVLAIIRAQVAALGGNALVSYFMNECVLLHNPHKNQGQCLMNVGGDVVQILTPLQLVAPGQNLTSSEGTLTSQ